MPPTEIVNKVISKKPIGLRISSIILLLEGLSSLFIFFSVTNTGFFSWSFKISYEVIILMSGIALVPFSFYLSNMKKIGWYSIVVLICVMLFSLLFIVISTAGGPSVAGFLLVPTTIVNLPILIYLLSIRNKFI